VEAIHNEIETACIKKLAEMFEAGKTQFRSDSELDLPKKKREATIRTMEAQGFITGVFHDSTDPSFAFRITPQAVQAAREIAEKEKEPKPSRNIVEEIKETAKGNRFLAWFVIGFIVLAAAVGLLNQSLELLSKFGLFHYR
jgi:hypothetical protein